MKIFFKTFLIVAMGFIAAGCAMLDGPINSIKTINKFEFVSLVSSGNIDEETHKITVEVPYGTKLNSLTPTITYTGASIVPASGVVQDFTTPVTYTVTAADASEQQYEVTVTVGLNPDKAITSFSFSNSTSITVISENNHKISIVVPYNAPVESLIPVIGHTGVSVAPESGVPNNFNNPVIYTVTAANGLTQEYEVTVTRQSSSAKAITRFYFINPPTTETINEAAHSIEVYVPSGTNRSSLTPTIEHTGVGVTPASGVAQDFSNSVSEPVIYTVTDGDGVTQEYTVTVPLWTPSLIEMISVPGGTFQRDATPANTSTVTGFYMSKTEITRHQFLMATRTDPSDTSRSSGMHDPVQQVSWYQAIVFCNKLSMMDGRTPVYTINGSTDPSTWGAVPTSSDATWDAVIADWLADGYRLPTEMEWMWAAMGADTESPGNPNNTGYAKAFAGSTGSNIIGNYAWTSENSGGRTHKVGTTGEIKIDLEADPPITVYTPPKANELGLYDMSGNAWEICWDWHSDYPSGSLNNYQGPVSGSARIGRGGSWYDAPYSAAVAHRDSTNPSVKLFHVGLRVVRRL